MNGTGIHWHGVRMLNTAYADGATSVTECPIAVSYHNPVSLINGIMLLTFISLAIPTLTAGELRNTEPAGIILTIPCNIAMV